MNSQQIHEITSHELKEGLEKNQICLIDVREAIENAEEKIAGSILMPLSSFDVAKVFVLKGNKQLVLHCRSGKRSMQAAQKLIENGCLEIYNLTGGIEDWKANNYPAIKSPQAPIGLMRQVQIVAGTLVLLGVVLSHLISYNFIFLSIFVGAGLIFAGITNTCALGILLTKMPWNQVDSLNKSCSIERK
jgi:rhodanese-related sulfurtransferase